MKRPSPTESATLYKVGIKKIGSDGNKWIIAENKNGIKRQKEIHCIDDRTIWQTVSMEWLID